MFALTSGAALAGNVKLTESTEDHVVVDANDATPQEILTQIGEVFQFKVERADSARDDPKITGRFEGALSHVLDRVLERENDFIEHDPSSRGAVTRIVLYGEQSSSASAAPLAVTSIPAPAPVPAPASPQTSPPQQMLVKIGQTPASLVIRAKAQRRPAPQANRLVRQRRLGQANSGTSLPVVK